MHAHTRISCHMLECTSHCLVNRDTRRTNAAHQLHCLRTVFIFQYVPETTGGIGRGKLYFYFFFTARFEKQIIRRIVAPFHVADTYARKVNKSFFIVTTIYYTNYLCRAILEILVPGGEQPRWARDNYYCYYIVCARPQTPIYYYTHKSLGISEPFDKIYKSFCSFRSLYIFFFFF